VCSSDLPKTPKPLKKEKNIIKVRIFKILI